MNWAELCDVQESARNFFLARVLVVAVVLQDERTAMSASGKRKELSFKIAPKLNFGHVSLNVHEKANSKFRETPPDHNVIVFMVHKQIDVVSIESLDI